ncbi:hypothetical protein [Vibrio lentus]|uniref:hypothetical protein n=1 Tax=Vibrio lentus TaxID=136468 RepID=UPI001CEFF8BD|nr:hypothetical protein [Vibrio lentus]MDN3632573.1 hypothetical protein [Vibrio lentus]
MYRTFFGDYSGIFNSHLLEILHSKLMADIWSVGINLALRISDLVAIKFSDIEEDRLTIRESKVGKVAQIALNPRSLEIIPRIKKAANTLSRRAVSQAFSSIGENTQ